jgi:L-asparagine transporter-like permease
MNSGRNYKKAVLGLDTAKLFVLAILSLVIISVVVLIVLDALGDMNVASSLVDNQSETILNNTSAALGDFFADAGTWFTLIGVVIIILIISSVIIVINRFGSEQSTDFG